MRVMRSLSVSCNNYRFFAIILPSSTGWDAKLNLIYCHRRLDHNVFVGVSSSPSLPNVIRRSRRIWQSYLKHKGKSLELVKMLLQSTVNILVSQYERDLFHVAKCLGDAHDLK